MRTKHITQSITVKFLKLIRSYLKLQNKYQDIEQLRCKNSFFRIYKKTSMINNRKRRISEIKDYFMVSDVEVKRFIIFYVDV